MGKITVLCLIAVFVTCVSGQVDPLSGGKPSNPGAKLGLNQKLMDYLSLQTGQAFNKMIVNTTAPPYRLGVANGEVVMSRFTVTNFVAPQYNYSLIKPNTVRWNMKDGKISAAVNLAHTIFTQKRRVVNGSMIMTASNMSLTTFNILGRASDGKPQLNVVQCSAQLEGFNLSFTNVSLFALFSSIPPKVVTQYAEDWAENLMCVVYRSFVASVVNTYLRTFLNRHQLGILLNRQALPKDRELFIDYDVIPNPSIGADLVDVPLRGAVVARTISYIPFFAQDMPDVRSNQMMDFFLSDYTVNTLFNVAHQQNLINFTAMPKYLSTVNAQYLRLSCSSNEVCLGSLFPNATFPSGSTAVMYFKTTQAPRLVINANQANWTARGSIRFDMLSPPAQYPKNVLLSANIPHVTGMLIPKVYQNTISASIDTTSISFEIKNPANSYGKFDSRKIGQLSNIVASIVEEMMNAFLGIGLPIPLTEGVRLTNSQLQLLRRTIVVSTDLTYSSNSTERKQI